MTWRSPPPTERRGFKTALGRLQSSCITSPTSDWPMTLRNLCTCKTCNALHRFGREQAHAQHFFSSNRTALLIDCEMHRHCKAGEQLLLVSSIFSSTRSTLTKDHCRDRQCIDHCQLYPCNGEQLSLLYHLSRATTWQQATIPPPR